VFDAGAEVAVVGDAAGAEVAVVGDAAVAVLVSLAPATNGVNADKVTADKVVTNGVSIDEVMTNNIALTILRFFITLALHRTFALYQVLYRVHAPIPSKLRRYA